MTTEQVQLDVNTAALRKPKTRALAYVAADQLAKQSNGRTAAIALTGHAELAKGWHFRSWLAEAISDGFIDPSKPDLRPGDITAGMLRHALKTYEALGF